MYPTAPTTTIGGVSKMVTASTTSFLLISKSKGDFLLRDVQGKMWQRVINVLSVRPSSMQGV